MRRLLAFLMLSIAAACAPAKPTPVATATQIPIQAIATASSTPAPASSTASSAPGDFPLAKGTTWVYTYEEYEPDPASPAQITTATYQFTETVTATQSIPPFFIAHVQHQEHLVKADPGWAETDPRRPAEFWYIVKGQQVYKTLQLLDLSNIQTDALSLAFDLPLTPGKSWCPFEYLKGQKIQDCTYAGAISVGDEQSYETPAGTFERCYQLTQMFNSGPILQWFCNGIGIVAEKYDHAGTRFGFQNTLASYTRGSP